MAAAPSWRPTLHYQTLAREYTMAASYQQSYHSINPSRSAMGTWTMDSYLRTSKDLVRVVSSLLCSGFHPIWFEILNSATHRSAGIIPMVTGSLGLRFQGPRVWCSLLCVSV